MDFIINPYAYGGAYNWTANGATLSAQEDKMVAYWKAEDTSDSIGSHTLTNNGSATFTAGKYNNAFTLNGTSQYFTAPDSDDWYPNSGQFSWFAWVKVSSQPATNVSQMILSQRNQAAGDGTYLRYRDTGGTKQLTFESYDNSVEKVGIRVNQTLTTDTWYLVGVTYDGTDFDLWVNETSIGSQTVANGMPNIAGSFYIGQYEGGSFYWNGQIDEVGIWKGYGADSSFVSALYNSGAGAFYTGEPDNTIMLLHMDGTDGSTDFIDSSQSGITITANGDSQVDTAIKKFGTGSLLVDGTDHLSGTLPASFNRGTGDWTVDCWFYATAWVNNKVLFTLGTLGSGSPQISLQIVYTTGPFTFFTDVRDDANNRYTSYSGAIAADTSQWNHAAIEKYGNNMYLYYKGVNVASWNVTGQSFNIGSDPFAIGANNGGANGFAGQIDEFRFSDIARYEGNNFTPPTEPYS